MKPFLICAGLLILGFSLAASSPQPNSKILLSTDPEAGGQRVDFKAKEVGHPAFMSPHANPILVHKNHVFVVNTPSDTVDIVNAATGNIDHRIDVGIDPVSIAVRPDGKELWVSNHVSDSVSVIDIGSGSRTYLQVIATIQEFDRKTKATRFDEPIGIAFANNQKAYVALSSSNQIAVIDVNQRKVTGRIKIPSQDPRHIVVKNNRLYVIPFESNNQTQLSGGRQENIDGELVTFDAWQHSIVHNNVLSIGHVLDIVKHPEVPDRDLFVFDTETDQLIQSVDTLGTLLYGLDIDSNGVIYVSQTDARNDINGRSGTKKHGLKELENRAFLNRVTRVKIDNHKQTKTSKDGVTVEFLDLEPLPPKHPTPEDAIATPYAIKSFRNGKSLLLTAAGSDKLVSLDPKNGIVLDSVPVGAVPRGIAIERGKDGHRAWVFNAVDNSVSQVNVEDSKNLSVLKTVRLQDSIDPELKKGRHLFNSAVASTTGTFSCASCHPDGHTDQLLWVLKTPVVTGGSQIMPRSTMPIRGLRETEPFHWDGIPGDPYGGINSANVHRHVRAVTNTEVPESSTRHLIDGALASTMAMVGNEEKNDSGKIGRLSESERDSMAKFLLTVPYPPAQKRSFTNELSERAKKGFELFHVLGDDDPTKADHNVCGDCHRMPNWVSTNTPGTGMDAPTWRGAYDRWLILPQGRLNMVEFPFFKRIAEDGLDEESIWRLSWAGRRRFNPVWNMVLEGSTGFSGTFARQFTLNQLTVDDDMAMELLSAMEESAQEEAVILQVVGALLEEESSRPVKLQFDPQSNRYVDLDRSSSNQDASSYTKKELIKKASEDKFVGTFNAHVGIDKVQLQPQPVLWTKGPIEQQRGHQDFPFLYAGNLSMAVSGRHIKPKASIVVDGRRVEGSIQVEGESLTVELQNLPENGLHFLQIQNPDGRFSNDFLFYVAKNHESALVAKDQIDRSRTGKVSALHNAIGDNDVEEVKRLLKAGVSPNSRHLESGSTALSVAAVHGNVLIAEILMKSGAKVSLTNRDGNTPLHIASFFCREKFVKFLLENEASIEIKNQRRETPIDIVSSRWNPGLRQFYQRIGSAIGLKLNLDQIKNDRKKIAEFLRSKKRS